jgi:predicted MFS family arabinose efflux permease
VPQPDRPRTAPDAAIRRLALARLVSVVGSMAAYTALVDLAFTRSGGSAMAVSMAVLLSIGAVGLLGPFGGYVADRWDRKRAMVASDLVGAALFLALAVVDPLWLVLGVAFLTAVASTPFRAGSIAAVPNLVGDPTRLAAANSRLAVAGNVGIVLGPGLGGLLVGLIGAEPVFVLNAASFVVSAWLVWSIRAPFGGATRPRADAGTSPAPAGTIPAPDADGGLLAGFGLLRRDRVLLVIVLACSILHFGAGLSIVADRPIAEQFGVGPMGFGVMLGVYGIGAVFGAWLASRLTASTEVPAIVTGFVIAGVAGITVWLAPVFALVVAANLAWGVGDAASVVGRSGLFQRRSPDAIRGRVAASNESIMTVTLMAGMILGGPLIDGLGAQAAYGVAGILSIAAAFLGASVVAEARRPPVIAAVGRDGLEPAG